MKAHPVKGLEPALPFRDNAEKIVAVRIDELWSFAEKAQNPRKVKASHDMRIAAKRLRYLLEITEVCFGAPAKAGAKTARGIQDFLGEIHDCDVMAERVRARAADTPIDDPRYAGLEALASYVEARRRVLHREFVDFWQKLEADGFRAKLEEGLGVAS